MECCLSAQAAADSCSHAAFSEVPYRMSWAAKGCWQPDWCSQAPEVVPALWCQLQRWNAFGL